MADGVPYYKPVAPEIPVVDNTAAKIVASSDLGGAFLRGFSVFAQAAAERKKLALESEQMVTDAALKSRQLDIARENNVLDFKVGMRNADATADYHRIMGDVAMKNAASIDEYRKDLIKTKLDPDNPLSPAGRAKAAALKEQDFADFAKEAAPLMDDPNPKNPVEYYANFQRLNDSWRFSNDTRVKGTLKQIQRMTEQHSVPLRDVRFGEDGEPVLEGEAKPRPVGQIMENLQDPEKADQQIHQLRANGFLVQTPTTKEVVAPEQPFVKRDYVREWLFGKPTQKQTVTETKLTPQLSTYAKMAAGVNFSRGKARPARTVVPAEETDNTALAPSITAESVEEAASRMQAEEAQAKPDTATLFPPTQTDKILAQARRAAKMPGANISGIKAMLQDRGIDPTLLDSE